MGWFYLLSILAWRWIQEKAFLRPGFIDVQSSISVQSNVRRLPRHQEALIDTDGHLARRRIVLPVSEVQRTRVQDRPVLKLSERADVHAAELGDQVDVSLASQCMGDGMPSMVVRSGARGMRGWGALGTSRRTRHGHPHPCNGPAPQALWLL